MTGEVQDVMSVLFMSQNGKFAIKGFTVCAATPATLKPHRGMNRLLAERKRKAMLIKQTWQSHPKYELNMLDLSNTFQRSASSHFKLSFSSSAWRIRALPLRWWLKVQTFFYPLCYHTITSKGDIVISFTGWFLLDYCYLPLCEDRYVLEDKPSQWEVTTSWSTLYLSVQDCRKST